MDTRQLTYFIALAESRTISEASKKLHIAQPALSQMLKQLETDLGTILIERSKKQHSLTQEGKILYQESLKIIKHIDSTYHLIKDTSSGTEGSIHFGINTLSSDLLLPVLKRFKKKYPNVRINIHQNESDILCHMVKERKLDLALVRFPIDSNDFTITYLNDEPFYFICSRTDKKGPNPSDLHAIVTNELLLPSTQDLGIYHLIIQYFTNLVISTEHITGCSDTNLLLQLVADGLYTSIVPQSLIDNHPNHNRIEAYPLNNPVLRSSYGVIHLTNSYLSTAAENFLAELKTYCKQITTL